MKITKQHLTQVIKEELLVVMEQEGEEKEYMYLSEVFAKALTDFVNETPILHTNHDVVEAIVTYDFTDDGERNALVLGTIKNGGGDFLYDFIKENGLLPALQTKIEQYAEKFAKPTKRPRKLTIIPYSDYQWNEDKWGENL
jgi:hypothetical protein